MNSLKKFPFMSVDSGKKSSLGLLLSMAKQELKRTEGFLAQVQEAWDMQIRGLQVRLDRHAEHEQSMKGLKDSQEHEQRGQSGSFSHEQQAQDVTDALDELRKQETTYKQELQTFLQHYKKSGVA